MWTFNWEREVVYWNSVEYRESTSVLCVARVLLRLFTSVLLVLFIGTLLSTERVPIKFYST